MAIGALGRLGPAGQQGCLAMIGFEVGLGLLFVAVAALRQDKRPERRRIHPPDGMGGVAVDADRQFLVRFGYLAAVHRGLEFLRNTEVALGAGRDDLAATDSRVGIVGRQDTVRRMTTGAGGGNHQTGHTQTLAVDAHLVALDDFMLLALVSERRLFSVAMTCGAQIGNIAGKGR